jgi:hypothetical protein
MGFLRGSLVIFLGILLFVSIFSSILLFVLSSSLEYKNVEKHFNPIISTVIYDSIDTLKVEERFLDMQSYCLDHQNYVIIQNNYNFDISCSDILEGDYQSVLEKQVDEFVSETYYRGYDCSFLDCFSKEGVPFFLISQETQNYVKSKFYFMIVFSLVLAGLMFLFLENRRNLLIVIGSLLIVSSLPLMKLGSLPLLFSGDYVPEVVSLFSETASFVFWFVFILGLFILGGGIALKFWGIDRIKGIFQRDNSVKKKSK